MKVERSGWRKRWKEGRKTGGVIKNDVRGKCLLSQQRETGSKRFR